MDPSNPLFAILLLLLGGALAALLLRKPATPGAPVPPPPTPDPGQLKKIEERAQGVVIIAEKAHDDAVKGLVEQQQGASVPDANGVVRFLHQVSEEVLHVDIEAPAPAPAPQEDPPKGS